MANDWWELQILCEPEMEDSLFWRLEVFGCRGMASESQGHLRLVRSYLPKTQGNACGGSSDSRTQTQAHVPLEELSLAIRQDALTMGLAVPEIQWRSLDEEDWASSWKQYWQPLEIGDRFLINPAWLPLPASERLVLRLDPGVAFGTGNHATTQLCLESLSRLLSDGNNAVVVDIGCGSGILAIGAVLLGASKVYAVDVDPLAVRSTASNRELNQISLEQLLVEQGSIEELQQLLSAPVDGIVCNILAEVIIGLIPAMRAITKPTTWGILSGILMNQSPLVTDALEQHGWFVAHIWQRQDWCCLNIQRSDKGL